VKRSLPEMIKKGKKKMRRREDVGRQPVFTQNSCSKYGSYHVDRFLVHDPKMRRERRRK
jgi:hypothetical protein